MVSLLLDTTHALVRSVLAAQYLTANQRTTPRALATWAKVAFGTTFNVDLAAGKGTSAAEKDPTLQTTSHDDTPTLAAPKAGPPAGEESV